MFGIGAWEMLVIGVIALLIFGPKRLPELARSLGKGLAEFRRASSDLRRSIDLDLDPTKLSAPDSQHEPPAQAGSPLSSADSPTDAGAGGPAESPAEAGGGSSAESAAAGESEDGDEAEAVKVPVGAGVKEPADGAGG
jgi:TatA/E family protein of Tat protein translocase